MKGDVSFLHSISENVKLSHDKELTVVAWFDQSMEETPLASVSKWVLSKVEEVSKILGLSFEGLEVLAWELFAELDLLEAKIFEVASSVLTSPDFKGLSINDITRDWFSSIFM